MALLYFSLEIVSDILHLLMNTIEEGFLTMPVFVEHLEYTGTKQITCFCLENV